MCSSSSFFTLRGISSNNCRKDRSLLPCKLALPVSPAPKTWYHSCRRQTRASISAKSRSMRGHHNEYNATLFSSYMAL
jgi:hypothetical protein